MCAGSCSRPFEEIRAEVGSHHVNTKLSHGSGERAIAAGNLEHCFASLRCEKFECCRFNNGAVEFVAGIPNDAILEGGVLVPDILGVWREIVVISSTHGLLLRLNLLPETVYHTPRARGENRVVVLELQVKTKNPSNFNFAGLHYTFVCRPMAFASPTP